MLMEKLKKYLSIKTIFLILTSIFALPSIIYLIKNNTISNFNEWFTFFLRDPKLNIESVISGLIFFVIIFLMAILMYLLAKNHKKYFKTTKQLFLFIFIITVLFAIILPFTTSDIFYYMGTGRLESKYGENPYYTSVKELQDRGIKDEILDRTGIWNKEIVVYGPLWAFLCKIFTFLSFDNVTFSLYVFKFFSVLAHMAICLIIYKLTRQKKFVILYGLNPFVLFEFITNVHNDIYMVLFVMLAFFFLLKKKNIWITLVFATLAVAIKYVAVLLLPFIVLYHFKDKKPLKRICYSALCAAFFIILLGLIYLIYFRDTQVLLNVFVQQNKYRESIMTIILCISKKYNCYIILKIAKFAFIVIFLSLYFCSIIKFILKDKITVKELMYENNKTIFLFLFLIITNLCPWYAVWLTPTMFWQKSNIIKLILFIQISYELCITYNFILFSENYKIGLFYLPTMGVSYIIYKIIEKNQFFVKNEV